MSSTSDMNPELEPLVRRWKEAAAQGRIVPMEVLCRDCPELLEPLRQHVAQLQMSESKTDAFIDPEQVETRIPGPESWGDGPPQPMAFGEPLQSVAITTRFQQMLFFRRGGLGELYTSQDEALQRQVIVKFIQPRHADDALTCSRFVAEAEITARLDHPGVVPVFGIGHTIEGRPFYVMRLIRGRSLDEALEEFHKHGPADPGERTVAFRNLLTRMISVCHTLSYAHNRGILHRDVKPQNIMLGRYGETLVVDWGLAIPFRRGDRAKASGEETLNPESSGSQASSGNAVGTPAYMSPEQSHPDIPLTPTADVYSLGATLYKVLTGMVPFSGRSSSEVIDKVRRADFAAPRRVQPSVPKALEAICLKAMSADPEKRYPLPAEMAADIERWLADEPVKADRETRWEQTQRFIRRHWAGVQSAAIALVLLLGVGLPLVMSYRGTVLEGERVKREQIESRLREASNYVSASLAAEMDLRWKSLQREAADPKLHEILKGPLWTAEQREQRKQVAQAPDAREGRAPAAKDENPDPLMRWVAERAAYNSEFTQADSWFFTDAEGKQLARYPDSTTVGDSFRFRSYFSGAEQDLEKSQADRAVISGDLHRSPVFKSAATKKWLITFTAPVKDAADPNKIIGRLSMAVELGKFTSINRGLGKDQSALLVDLRPYDGNREGVVLHHPQWEQTPLKDDTPISELPALPEEMIPRLNALRENRTAGASDERTVLIEEYYDPLEKESGGRWLAAFQPVFVQRHQAAQSTDTGLIIIVQTRAGQ